MKININYHKDIAVFDIVGVIDINSSGLIETTGKILRKGDKKIIMNLDEVDFIDYNGLSVLAITYKSVLNSNGSMKLCGVPVHVMELLHIVKLDNVFDIYIDLNKAIESFEHKKTSATKETPGDEQPLRRRFPRLGIDVTVYYKRNDAHPEQNQLYSGLVGNISGTGLFLRSINMLPVGTKVDLDIVLPEMEEKKSISAKGMIVWIADKQLQPDFYPGMGIQFADMQQKTQEEIVHFIDRHIVK
ncbi:MAG: PilZ domain-containing protein [Candidatus Omnitrophica bacterium]|nr:PilZ domain-containing protein [Candidatus Omnitrophota bacterium]